MRQFFSGDHAQSFQRNWSKLNQAAPAPYFDLGEKENPNLLGCVNLEYILGTICFSLSKEVKSLCNEPAGGTAWVKTET